MSKETAAGAIPQQLETPLVTRITGMVFFAIVGWLLFRGWQLRDEHYITAERGLGYALGIAGGVMMLLLLLYPLRKNLRLMRNWGPIRYWFRVHMIFGILGPSLILFHSNFRPGSLNSNIALGCMLLVASSGIVGRFFYSRVHYGLYGRKASLQELGEIIGTNRSQLAWFDDQDGEITSHFQSIETMAISPANGLLHSMGRWLAYIMTAWWHHWRLQRLMCAALQQKAATEHWQRRTRRLRKRELRRYLNTYTRATRKVLEFHFYERLFSLWHVLHLPFFFMMLLSGIVHVIAVHMY